MDEVRTPEDANGNTGTLQSLLHKLQDVKNHVTETCPKEFDLGRKAKNEPYHRKPLSQVEPCCVSRGVGSSQSAVEFFWVYLALSPQLGCEAELIAFPSSETLKTGCYIRGVPLPASPALDTKWQRFGILPLVTCNTLHIIIAMIM